MGGGVTHVGEGGTTEGGGLVGVIGWLRLTSGGVVEDGLGDGTVGGGDDEMDAALATDGGAWVEIRHGFGWLVGWWSVKDVLSL